MTKLTPVDLSFLLLENSSRAMHMNAFMLFDLPPAQRETFVPRLLRSYRTSAVAKPFNQKLKWLGKGVASWEQVVPDMRYHVRHIAIPKPGTMKQFYETVSFINSNLLDRGHPLWECYIIEGIENGRVAVMIKVHHALIDGEGGLRVLRGYLSDSPRDKRLRAPFAPMDETPRPKRQRAAGKPVEDMLKRLSSLPRGLLDMGGEVVKLGAQSLKLAPRVDSLPFGASPTLFNNLAQSGERRYANCELPLETIRAIAKASGKSVNDVLMTAIDDALHTYLARKGRTTDKPLVAIMPMSIRSEGEAAAGNQAVVELIPMGQPKASLSQRLGQIHEATQRAKAKGQKLPKAVRQFYSLFVFGSTTVNGAGAVFAKVPSANLVISNMKGPSEQLYLGGVPMTAFHGLPIVPPGSGLNITFASVHKHVCLAVGAAPEAVDEPFLITQFIEQAVSALAKQFPSQPVANVKSRRPPKVAIKSKEKSL